MCLIIFRECCQATCQWHQQRSRLETDFYTYMLCLAHNRVITFAIFFCLVLWIHKEFIDNEKTLNNLLTFPVTYVGNFLQQHSAAAIAAPEVQFFVFLFNSLPHRRKTSKSCSSIINIHVSSIKFPNFFDPSKLHVGRSKDSNLVPSVNRILIKCCYREG